MSTTMINFPVPVPASTSPTSRWLAIAELEPLEGPEGVAERLLLLIHYGIDWKTGWVTNYRDRYWSTLLPDRIWCATFQASTLRRWWRDVAQEVGSAPRSKQERHELEQLLRHEAQPVLEVMRSETEALLLRTRITSEAVRSARALTATEQVPA